MQVKILLLNLEIMGPKTMYHFLKRLLLQVHSLDYMMMTKLSRRWFHVVLKSAGESCSHVSLSCHKCWIRIFAFTTTSTKSPSGSNNLAKSELIVRFVAVFVSSAFTLTQTQLILDSHIRSKVLIGSLSLLLKSKLTSWWYCGTFCSSCEWFALHLR